MARGDLFPTTIQAEGLTELNRFLGKVDKKVQRDLQKEIRKLAEPASDLIRREAAGHGFSAPTVAGIRPGSSRGHAVVRQRRGKRTGSRPDFGSIQFRLAFIPGAQEAEPIVREGVEDFLDRLTTGDLSASV